MFDARELLGQLMQAGMTRSTGNRVGHALGEREFGGRGDQVSDVRGGLGQSGDERGNPLSDLLGGLGLGGGGGQGGVGGGLADMLGGAGRVAKENPFAVGGLAALAGAILGGKTGVPKGAIGGGALALLASLALSSLGGRGQAQDSPSQGDLARDAPLGLREPQTPGEEQELQDKATLILQAMINAAKADGSIDQGEIKRITDRLETDGAAAEAREFIGQEMLKPMDMDSLIRSARTPQTAVEVYAASLLAIEVDTPAERDYLRRLAEGLSLAPTTVQRVHQALGITA
jgi:uncharacterized membrane protein YebE (DUF533 family)